METFTVSQAFSLAWKRFSSNWVVFVGLSLLGLIVGSIPLVGVFVFYPAIARASLLAVRRGQVSFGEEAFGPFGKLLKAGLFTFLVSLVPLVVMAIGYLYLMMRGIGISGSPGATFGLVLGYILLFLFWLFFWAGPYFILDGKTSLVGAFGASFSLFSQHASKVIGLVLISIVVVFLGALACGIGLFIAFPVVQLAWAAVYVGLMEGGLPDGGGALRQL